MFCFFFGMASYLLCAGSSAYARHAFPVGGFSNGSYHSKKIVTVQQGRSISKNSSFYGLFSLSGQRFHKIQFACGMECQNILAKIFNPIWRINMVFVIILLLFVFIQKLLVFPVNHPPRSLSV